MATAMLKKHKYRTMVSHLSCVSLYHRTSVPIINKFLLAHIWLRIRNLIGLVLVYAIMSAIFTCLFYCFNLWVCLVNIIWDSWSQVWNFPVINLNENIFFYFCIDYAKGSHISSGLCLWFHFWVWSMVAMLQQTQIWARC